MLSQRRTQAAPYLRASTEHQNYSTSHQEAALRHYADKQNCEIVSVFRDEGRSGLTLEGRTGLLSLFEAIRSGQPEFTTVLVYDVSRWGRFQDIDEAAFYKYACRRAGTSVCYCAGSFDNDGSPIASLIKGLKGRWRPNTVVNYWRRPSKRKDDLPRLATKGRHRRIWLMSHGSVINWSTQRYLAARGAKEHAQ